MKKKSIVLLSATIVIAAISAFGLSEQTKHNQIQKSSCQADAATLQLADIGINGGVNVE